MKIYREIVQSDGGRRAAQTAHFHDGLYVVRRPDGTITERGSAGSGRAQQIEREWERGALEIRS